MVVIFIVAATLGGASGQTASTEADARADKAEAAISAAEHRADQAEADAKDAVADAKAEADATVAEGEQTNADRSAELDTRSSDLDAREATVAQRETDVQARETAVGAAEAARDANTFGDGIFAVGTDIQPGRYHTDGSGDSCYYALLSGTGNSLDDIVDNNNITGPVTLDIHSAYFESTRCGTWTKVG